MKSLLSCIVIISLCSCGRSTKSVQPEQAGQSQLASQNTELFTLPKLNLTRSVTIDKDVSTFYEDMTINSKKEGTVLGDEAFYIMINENVSPSYSEIHLSFYSRTKINNIFYLDAKNSPFSLSEIKKENLTTLKLRDVTDFYKDGLVWGKRNLDNPENDMENKAYVIRTEEVQTKDNVEYIAESTYLIWFECLGSIKMVSETAYSCSKYNLKLHYKLLDYTLTSNKI